ncbi:MAG: 50S ribosomal protein L29 [Anaerolineales bacterium]|jgi:large subunit ribosomal protein L29|nr:50S ribosomal protein L29 [Anaerolineaceae bacterium]MDP7345419.1 50S ribosomal protein L29 [Anaerolineales bacterium]MDP7643713.1 50S ribosomal protein L29 [Anaerolineales bacterium]|tara:strand:+ start:713 stop:931 length:219 start_codon:yes stop_codon:yes gene_type:complete
MQPAEIRAFSPAELQSRIDDAREALFKLRFQTAFGQATDTSQFRKTRRDLARMLTVQREQVLADAAAQATEG